MHKVHIEKKIATLLQLNTFDFAEIRIAENKSTNINLSLDTIENISSGTTQYGSIRILKKGMWGFISFNEIEKIETYFSKCMESTNFLQSNKKTGIIEQPITMEHFSNLDTTDFLDIPIEEKLHLISSYNDILKDSSFIQTTRAIYRDAATEYAYFNSEGSKLTYDKKYCGISLSAIAKDGSKIQPFHFSTSGFKGFDLVKDKSEEAEKVVRTAVDLLKAEEAPAGTHTIITNQKLSGVFIHEAFGHLSEADFIYENEAFKKIMTLGKAVANEKLNVIDDGTINESGYIPFDDEGVAPQKTYLIKNGTLSGRLHSRETAYKMNEEPTGNARSINVMRQPIVRMTNTYIDNGEQDKEDLFESIDTGIYANDIIGGQTNLEMFTFTAGYGYEIKNGKKGKMYKDIVLSGNVFSTLNNIEKIANDKKMFGGLGGCGKNGQSPLPVSFGGPHLLIKDVLIGGNQ